MGTEKFDKIEEIVSLDGYSPEKFRIKNMIPPSNHLLIRLIPIEEFQKGSIVVPSMHNKQLTPYGVVLRKGRACGEYTELMNDLEEGDLILIQPGCGMKEEDILCDVTYNVLFVTHILGKFDNVLK